MHSLRALSLVRIPHVFGKINSMRTLSLVSRNLSLDTKRQDSFLNSTNVIFLEEVYRKWKADPTSVSPSWDNYFKNMENNNFEEKYTDVSVQTNNMGGSTNNMAQSQLINLQINNLISSYRNKGHLASTLDSLNLHKPMVVDELEYKYHGISDSNLDNIITDPPKIPLFSHIGQNVSVKVLINHLKKIYTGNAGLEVQHLLNNEEKNWLVNQFDTYSLTYKPNKSHLLDRVAFSVKFEKFCQDHFRTTKRFGIEGGESVIMGIKGYIDRVTELGAEAMIIGMPHRGRLNVLANIIRKPLEHIFQEFGGIFETSVPTDPSRAEWYSQGDVKYHLGTSNDRIYSDGRKIHLSLSANPSHLEAVDPVILGRSRAKQHVLNDTDQTKVVSLLMHGDAAFAGQGIVYETMQMSQVDNYKVGGTLHVIVNNQIGFTADPEQSRSTYYCSDLGKTFDIPILHVNGDDVEAVDMMFRLAAEYRQKFHKDIIVEVVGYRKHGHNEVDSPYFTQPTMYKAVDKHPGVLEIYKSKLLSEGSLKKEEISEIESRVDKIIQDSYKNRESYKPKKSEWLSANWAGFKSPEQLSKIQNTGFQIDKLRVLGAKIFDIPKSVNLHPNLVKIYDSRKEAMKTGNGIDWGTAEALAFGSLLTEGYHVRLSGQDVERGTFSHRHAVVHDQTTNAKYVPLSNIPDNIFGNNENKIAKFVCCNSILSEYGTLGYEVGYSLENPNQLVIWEAQFGDFANGAQIMIDNILASGESKWLRQTGLTVLLPHGYDGQGAEHSSSRLERYLALCDDDPDDVPDLDFNRTKQIQNANWQIINCTTPANYFHALRRQLHREFRKPLVVASPKFLLKYRDCVSNIDEFSEGKLFQRMYYEKYPEELLSYDKIRKILFCSGKIYYELLNHRRNQKINDVVIIRIEQISPFPFDLVGDVFNRYPSARSCWVQEEPKNMGAYSYIRPRFVTSSKIINGKGLDLGYVGRRSAASPATGYGQVHQKEQLNIITRAFE